MQGPLFRYIFPLFVLTIWVTFATWLVQGDWTGLNWLLLAAAAVCCLIVFFDFTSIFNYGYSLSMVLINVLILVGRDISTASLLISGVAILFGLRLLWFTHRRRQAKSFAGGVAAQAAANEKIPTPVRVVLFVLVTSLYTFMSIPPYLVAVDGETTTWVVVGAVLMVIGLLVEAIADEQKQRAKNADNTTFVRTGLYSRTRHPNYTGEIVFQVGLACAALGAFDGWWQLIGAVVSPAYIVVLMCFSAKSGTERMRERYANDPAYAVYERGTGGLLPIASGR